MFCSNCGIQLPDALTFCYQCGTRVGAYSEQQPLLSRKQFYLSSPETQKLYQELRVWQKLAGVGFLIAGIAQLAILSRIVIDWTMPLHIGLMSYIVAMIGFIIALVFSCKALPSLSHLNKMYKTYVQWHKNSYSQ